MSANIRMIGRWTIGLFLVVSLVMAPGGCGRGKSDPASSLPPEQAEAVKALAARKIQVVIRDGQVTYVDFYGVTGVPEVMPQLKSFPNLQKINFSSTDITDDSLVHLAALTNLKELALTRTRITDKGVAHLAGLTQLELLNFNNVPLTDAALEHIKKLKNLVQLHLNETMVSDAGLKLLADCQKLKHLLVYGTNVTPAGVEEFRKTHPEAVVDNGGDEPAANADEGKTSASP